MSNAPISPNLPSLETIANLVRSILNDSFAGATNTPGEGQVVTDFVPNSTNTGLTAVNNPQLMTQINAAIRTLYRKLRIIADPTMLVDNYIVYNTPVINGPLGLGEVDPAIQCRLDTTGFWDGSTYHTLLKLPTDMFQPLRLWERTNSTTDTFIEMKQQPDGLYPADQVDRLVYWEYRQGNIYFNGATTNRDVRIRYQAAFPQFFTPDTNLATTYIPIQDCEDFVANQAAMPIARSLGASAIMLTSLQQDAQSALADLKNERVRAQQRISFSRRPYNDAQAALELDVYGI